MADKSRIAWCDATINPCYGCTPVSPACDHCYAVRMAPRQGELTEGTFEACIIGGKRFVRWTGQVNLFPERMGQALKWRKPRRIFVGSMTDLFHESVPDEFLDRVFAYMNRASRHTFLLLTKRPERMKDYIVSRVQEPAFTGVNFAYLGGARTPTRPGRWNDPRPRDGSVRRLGPPARGTCHRPASNACRYEHPSLSPPSTAASAA